MGLKKISTESFSLTKDGVSAILTWSKGIKQKKPGSKVYFIAESDVLYGLSRLYQIQAGDDHMEVIVVRSFDELPKEIIEKIS